MRLNSWLKNFRQRFPFGLERSSLRRRNPRLTSATMMVELLESRRMLTANLVATSDPVLSIPATKFDQIPSVASDSSGDYVVVASSTGMGENGTGVHAQRYDSTGTAQGAEFVVTSDTTAALASVAMDQSGDFVITWNSSTGILAQQYDAAGNAKGAVIQVSGTAGTDTNPQVAMDAAGDFAITWQLGDQFEIGVDGFVQRYDSSGTALGSQVEIGTQAVGYQDIAMDSTGDFVITWVSLDGIQAQRFDSTGTAQGGTIQIDVNLIQHPDAVVAMDASGNFVVTWNSRNADVSDGTVFARMYDASGTALGDAFQVNPDDAPVFDHGPSAISMNASGDFAISWAEWTNTHVGIVTQVYDASGTANGDPLESSSTVNPQLFPGVAIDDQGDTVVAWASFDQFGYNIYTQRFAAPLPPTLTKIELTPVEDPGNQPVTLTSSQIVSDPDSTTEVGATVQIADNYQPGQDRLTFADTPDITGSWDANTGIMTLSGTASVTDYQSALRDIEFLHTGANTDSRTVTFQVTDGVMASNVVSRSVVIGPQVVSLTPITANPATGSTVKFGLTFSEPVTGVSKSNFTLNENGVKGGVITVSGSGASYVLTVSNLSGSGMIGVNVTNFATIKDSTHTAEQAGFTGTLLTLFQAGGPIKQVGKTLTITGTAGDDLINITENSNLQITIDGVNFNFDPTKVTSIILQASSGNDTTNVNSLKTGTAFTGYCGNGADAIIVNAAVTTPVTLVGGTGSATLTGGSGNDTLIGGTGNNTMNGKAGNDTYILKQRTATQTQKLDILSDTGGTNTLSFAGFSHNLIFDLALGINTIQTVDTLTGYQMVLQSDVFQNVLLGSGDDIVIGNATLGTQINGGSGNNVLAGGTGNDTLIGAGRRDILIGGAGNDRLIGNGGEDILIGGSTKFANNTPGLSEVILSSLQAIQREWMSGRSYAIRVGHLNGTIAGGLNGISLLNSSTVSLGTTKETLLGGGTRDWFWATALDSTDRRKNEFLN